MLSVRFYDKVKNEYINFENVIRVSFKDNTWFVAFSTPNLPVFLESNEFDFIWVM